MADNRKNNLKFILRNYMKDGIRVKKNCEFLIDIVCFYVQTYFEGITSNIMNLKNVLVWYDNLRNLFLILEVKPFC